MANTSANIYEYCIDRIALLTEGGKEEVKNNPDLLKLCKRVTSLVLKRDRLMVLDLQNHAPVQMGLILFGYLAPAIIALTLVLNAAVVLVLTRRRLRSPTNVILVSIAIVDTFTGILSLPEYIYTYHYAGYRNFPNMAWCRVIVYMCRTIPQILHTTALWLTAILALQRYVGVGQLPLRNWVCRYKGTFALIVIIILFSLLSHCFQFFLVPKPVKVIGKELFTSKGMQTTLTCYRDLEVITSTHFVSVYTWVRLSLSQILPCLLLLIFNVLLIRITYKSYAYRRRLVIGHRLSEIEDSRKTVKTSVMLILITSCTCIVEILVDITLILNFLQSQAQLYVSQERLGKLILISNFMVILTFPLNFIFFFALSNSFRNVLSAWLKPLLIRKVTPSGSTEGQPHSTQSITLGNMNK